jgi:hypothetical protein
VAKRPQPPRAQPWNTRSPLSRLIPAKCQHHVPPLSHSPSGSLPALHQRYILLTARRPRLNGRFRLPRAMYPHPEPPPPLLRRSPGSLASRARLERPYIRVKRSLSARITLPWKTLVMTRIPPLKIYKGVCLGRRLSRVSLPSPADYPNFFQRFSSEVQDQSNEVTITSSPTTSLLAEATMVYDEPDVVDD